MAKDTIFVTGGNGYLGSYVCDVLLRETDARIALLIRAKSDDDAREKLWRGFQLHMDGRRFWDALGRIDFVHGDLTAPGLGIERDRRRELEGRVESILHIAASLNRKSEKACLDTNLRGTLSVVKLAREIADGSGLRRFSHVSTVAVAGRRDRETVHEDAAIDWARSDYDPYARTKKFAEHMVRELLGADVPLTFFRPSIVMGDAKTPETTQFDMVRAFCALADMPAVPMRSDARLDIVNADYVGRAIARLHTKARTDHTIYHLSAGEASPRAEEIVRALVAKTGRRGPRFVPQTERAFATAVDVLAGMKARNAATRIGSLLKVFLPYVTFDTVFDNARVVGELGEAPVPFTEYAASLYAWAKGVGFEFPYVPLPDRPVRVAVAKEVARV